MAKQEKLLMMTVAAVDPAQNAKVTGVLMREADGSKLFGNGLVVNYDTGMSVGDRRADLREQLQMLSRSLVESLLEELDAQLAKAS